jgi:predicted DNA-binding ArsR family transcriptional regulator
MEEKITVKQVGFKYGIYLALVTIIYSLILQIIGQATNRPLGYIALIFVVVALWLAHRDFKRDNEYMSYGQGLGISMIIISVSAVLSSIFSYIYIKFVDDSMLETIREQAVIQMEERGMSDSQIEQAMEMQARFTTPEMILVFGILASIFFGFIIALIVTAFTKKSNPELET